MKLTPVHGSKIKVTDNDVMRRYKENRNYVFSLKNENLLYNFRFEAGLENHAETPCDMHDGWESPCCQLRGHFVGHWLSAAAMIVYHTNDAEIKAKADYIVDELDVCQQENGGEWVASIPEKYLHRIAQGKEVWAPQYTIHKLFMGLLDMYELAGNRKALDIAVNFAEWFYRWSGQFTREEMDNILDFETGGMLEVFVQLYAITKADKHKELVERYYRGRLFDKLLAGEDALTNMHANTTVPEVLGCAKAYEVTGEQRYYDICAAYWEQAVDKRPSFATGSQSCGEVWTPSEFASRLGDKNQEHCVVYNMMRLAEFLYRHTGETKYADYWERNYYNGIMAQGYWLSDYFKQSNYLPSHPLKGLLTYFLPLEPGAQKVWAHHTKDFYCCHGTLVQANAVQYQNYAYTDSDKLYITQYFANTFETQLNGVNLTVTQTVDGMEKLTAKYPHHPDFTEHTITIKPETAAEFTLLMRIPCWQKGEPIVKINGQNIAAEIKDGYFVITRKWEAEDTKVSIVLNKSITTESLPGADNTVAFMYGPMVLAGICDYEKMLYTNGKAANELLVHDNEREWGNWKLGFKTVGQPEGLRFKPLHKIGYEKYTVYFPIA